VKIYRLVVDGRLFPVSDEQELARVKRRIVTAVRRNGGFVTLRETDGHLVDVLFTTTTRVRVEQASETRVERADGRDTFSRYSLDELSFDELTFDVDLAF
jgi:hypothetical protein